MLDYGEVAEVPRHLGAHPEGALVVDRPVGVGPCGVGLTASALAGLVSPLVVKDAWMGP